MLCEVATNIVQKELTSDAAKKLYETSRERLANVRGALLSRTITLNFVKGILEKNPYVDVKRAVRFALHPSRTIVQINGDPRLV